MSLCLAKAIKKATIDLRMILARVLPGQDTLLLKITSHSLTLLKVVMNKRILKTI